MNHLVPSSLPALPTNSRSQLIQTTMPEIRAAIDTTCRATRVEELTDHHANLVIGMFRRCAPDADWIADKKLCMDQILRSITKFYALAHPDTKILGGDVRSRIDTQIKEHLEKFAKQLPNDIGLIADTEEVIPASALLLIHTSGLFDKLLCANFDESRRFIETYPVTPEEPAFALRMGGISTAALKTLVSFITKQKITDSPSLDILAQLFQTSDYWDLNPAVEKAFRQALLNCIAINEDQVSAYYILRDAGDVERADTCLHNIVEKWSDSKILGYLEGKRRGLKGVDADKLKLCCQNQVMIRLLTWLESAKEKDAKKVARFEAIAPQFLCNLNNFGDLSKLYMFHGYWVQERIGRK